MTEPLSSLDRMERICFLNMIFLDTYFRLHNMECHKEKIAVAANTFLNVYINAIDYDVDIRVLEDELKEALQKLLNECVESLRNRHDFLRGRYK